MKEKDRSVYVSVHAHTSRAVQHFFSWCLMNDWGE